MPTLTAASAHGYLTGTPGVLVVVPGPGVRLHLFVEGRHKREWQVIHALAGMANSTENGWPLICLGGGNPTYLTGLGGFQEMDQIGGARLSSLQTDFPII